MKKSITITLLLIIVLTSCVTTTQNNEIVILNNTNNIIEADIYDTWSGETDHKWNLQKGINKFNIKSKSLFGLYAKGFPEKTIYTHSNATLTFENGEIILDEINQEINAHYTWSQQLITGESQSIFHWKNRENRPECINDWEKFDSILYKVTQNIDYKVSEGSLKSQHLNTYPAAYVLIDKICKSDFISIAEKTNYLNNQLEKTGINKVTKNNFLKHYLTPQKLSLRNDSIVDLVKKYFPDIAQSIELKYKGLKTDAKIYKGMHFPDITYANKTISAAKLVENHNYAIIDFWATWCIPCIKQMPDMNDYAKKHKGIIKFISLSVDNKRDYEKWVEISDQYNEIQHIWLSDTTNIRENLGIKGLPRMILLDKKGKVIDPNFPHLYDTLSHLWIKSLANMQPNELAENFKTN